MTTKGTLDERYLTWLYSQVGMARNTRPSSSHWLLCRQLYQKPFTWFVPNDGNRFVEGVNLRFEYLDDSDDDLTQAWIDDDCSVMEMLVALARKAAFETSGQPSEWFWKMISNVGLRRYTDETYNRDTEMVVNEALDIIVERDYDKDGNGGFFPLINSREDQREVELWFQLQAYVIQQLESGALTLQV